MTARVEDDEERSRYVARVEDRVAGFMDYRREDGSLVLVHTEVEDAFEGQGVGSTLVRSVLDAARAAGVAVVPSCPFVRRWLQRHPEYVDLVPASRRAEFDLEAAARG